MAPWPEQDLAEPLLLPQSTVEDNDEEICSDHDHDLVDEARQHPAAAAADDDEEGVSTEIPHPVDSLNPYKNHNVRLCFILCVVSGVADSVWSSVILSGFLFALASAMGQQKENNTLVGLAEMVQGISMLLCALPIGMWADRTGKAKVARMGGALMLVTIAMTLWALLVVDKEATENEKAAKRSYVIMLVALAMWGVVGGISNGPTQALFSDSIPRGRRSELLTWLYSCYLISSSVGPIVSIAMLSSSSAEDWSIAETFPVFFAGILLEIPAAILMCFFAEKHVVPEVGDTDFPPTEHIANLGIGAEITSISPSPTVAAATQSTTLAQATDTTSTSPVSSQRPRPPRRYYYNPLTTKQAVPYVLFLSSLIVAVGSGASVKYFPLFFKEIGLSSAVVQGIYFVVPMSISGFSFVGQRLGKRFGRIETSVAFNTLGTLLLYVLTWSSQHVGAGDTLLKAWIVMIYLLRTGIMNCCYPLLESVLMDAVPSNQRAKWKSLESISAFGWTGSALAGGILSDKHSYQYTFAMTATVQLFGGLMMLPIRSLVESEEERGGVAAPETLPSTDDDLAETGTTEHEQALAQPLLSAATDSLLE